MEIIYKKLENTLDDQTQLKIVLYDFNEEFSPSLGDICINIDEFSEKLMNSAIVILAIHQCCIIGFVAIYANDRQTKTAFISLIAVKPDFYGRGISAQLLSIAEDYAYQHGMTSIKLEVRQDNLRAIKFYNNHGYEKVSQSNNSFFFEKSLKSIIKKALLTYCTNAKVDLSQSNVNEPTISHRLAVYLENKISGYSVDCEYNKVLTSSGCIDKSNANGDVVRPDIIVHKRNKDHRNGFIANLIVLELKKAGIASKKCSNDIEKLQDFINTQSYQLGCCIGILKKSITVRWIEKYPNVDQISDEIIWSK